MKVKIESTSEIIATHGGNLLLGELIARSTIRESMSELDIASAGAEIPTGDVIASYIGTLAQAQPAFEAIEQYRKDPYFAQTLGIPTIPSCSTLRQRMDALGRTAKDEAVSLIMRESCVLLGKLKTPITPCFGVYVPLDIDVSVHDNSGTKKEGVSWTYKNLMGYSPIYAYLGSEGYGVNVEFREGSQHCQNGTPAFIQTAISHARLATKAKILVRMDSGNDAAENMKVMQENEVSFIIKRNPRKESPQLHFAIATEKGHEIEGLRDGKRIFVYECNVKPDGCEKDVRMITFATERTCTASGQILLAPEYEIESYYAMLENATALQIQKLYHDHGTSEQFHSEIKTDLDLERLPSGKFATNAIVLALGIFAYNLLRIIGQESLRGDDCPPTPHKIKRRRVRTVIDRYISLAVKLVTHARQKYVKLSSYNPWLPSFSRLYAAFSA